MTFGSDTIAISCIGGEWDFPWLAEFGAQVLCAFREEKSELSIVLCDETTIQKLNRDYRKKDKPTDVLSFSQREGETFGDEGMLGDVILCIPVAEKQARDFTHPLEEELQKLLIHGVAHLLGYDHEIDSEAEVMEAEERRVAAYVRRLRIK